MGESKIVLSFFLCFYLAKWCTQEWRAIVMQEKMAIVRHAKLLFAQNFLIFETWLPVQKLSIPDATFFALLSHLQR